MNTGREQRSRNAAMCRAIWCPLDKDAGISNTFHTVKVAVALMQVVIRTYTLSAQTGQGPLMDLT